MDQLEIERKFLLRRLPDNCVANTRLEIQQFYTSSGRLRKTRNMNNQFIYHLNKKILIAPGVNQEYEKELTKNEYEDLLYDSIIDKHLNKFRYILFHPQDKTLKWEIDVISNPQEASFHHMQLIIAEIELPTLDYDLILPKFIHSNLILEVTQIPEFTNFSLATKKHIQL